VAYNPNAEDIDIEQSPIKEEAATSSTHHDYNQKRTDDSDSDVDEQAATNAKNDREQKIQ
jgi:hypothetical protein